MDNAKVLFRRMSLLQLLRRNKGSYALCLCLIVVAVGTVVFSNSVLRAQKIPEGSERLTLISPEQCRKRVENVIATGLLAGKKPGTLDQLIEAYVRSEGRSMKILRGTARFGRGAEYEAICEMFGRLRCVQLVFCTRKGQRTAADDCVPPFCPPRPNCDDIMVPCLAGNRPPCSKGDLQCCDAMRLQCYTRFP